MKHMQAAGARMQGVNAPVLQPGQQHGAFDSLVQGQQPGGGEPQADPFSDLMGGGLGGRKK